jgi:hypothetical protein
MKDLKCAKMPRRQFIFKTIPACALTCSLGNQLFGMSPELEEQELHMFDREFPMKLTYRKFIEGQNFQFIELAKVVQDKLGKEETLELIKQMATKFNLERGKKQAENSSDRSLKSYTRMFAEPKEWEGILRMEIVEDSESAFELKVSECIQAANYIDHDAADIGYANVCWGDYAWAEGFNPKIKLVRDKTLMEGHSCCNHRYVWTG